MVTSTFADQEIFTTQNVSGSHGCETTCTVSPYRAPRCAQISTRAAGIPAQNGIAFRACSGQNRKYRRKSHQPVLSVRIRGDPGLANKIWGKKASGVKSRWLFASVCVHAAICVAQTSPMLLAAGGGSPTAGSGAPPLSYRVSSVNPTPTSFRLRRATGASFSELAANAAVSMEYGPATITSPSFRYSLLTSDESESGLSGGNSDADDSSPSAKLGLKTPEPAQPDTHIHLVRRQQRSAAVDGYHARLEHLDRGGDA